MAISSQIHKILSARSHTGVTLRQYIEAYYHYNRELPTVEVIRLLFPDLSMLSILTALALKERQVEWEI